MLCHITRLPCVMGTGLGLKDCAPFWPVMLTVVAPLGAGLEVGEVAGVFELPRRCNPRPKTKIALESNRNRMSEFQLRKQDAVPIAAHFPGDVRASNGSIYRHRIDLHFFDRVSCQSGTWRGSKTARAG